MPQKRHRHTFVLTGEGWVQELLGGHPERIRNELGMHQHVFAELLIQLHSDLSMDYIELDTDSELVSLAEQVAIFLYSCVTGLAIGHVGERFRRSNETISHCFQKILLALSQPPFYTTYVRPPTARDPVPPKIRDKPKYWPFFKDCLGALDGGHFDCTPPLWGKSGWRNDFLSQNCLYGCSFDRTFTYSLAGREGSATDAEVYEDARSQGLVIPEGKYYLAGAGYPLSNELLVPYRGVQYDHLAESGSVDLRPTNKEELFNLRHASARKVIWRILRALKRRFQILQLADLDYGIDIKVRLPAALCAIHNFISKYDPDEGPLPERVVDGYYDDIFACTEPEEASEASVKRDQIAEMMWQSYQQVRDRQ